MNSRQRLFRALTGGKPDMVPVSFFIQEVYSTYYFNDKSRNNRIDDAYVISKELGLDIQLRPRTYAKLPCYKSSANWNVEVNEFFENPQKNIKETRIITPEKIITEKCIILNINEYKTFSSNTKKFINNKEDFRVFKKYFPYEHLDVNKDNITEEIKYAQDLLKDDGIVIPWTSGGVYNRVSDFISDELLLTLPYEDLDFYSEIMKFFLEIVIDYSRHFTDNRSEFVAIEGNVANGRTFSGKYFYNFIFPYEKKLISELKKKNVHVLYHNCGYIGELLNCYLDMGIDAWETLTPPPYGDVILRDVKSKVKNRMGLMGGFDQIKLLKEGSLDEIKQVAERVLCEGKPDGGYVFATSDWLEEDTPIENIKFLINYIKKNGSYN